MLQISQRPLQATAADAGLFVDRGSELEKLARAVRHGFNTLMLGERGSGKTSLLRRFEADLGGDGVECRFVEASGATSIAELIDLLYLAIHGRRRDQTDRLMASIDGRDSPPDDLRRLAPSDGRRIVVFVDSLPDPALVQRLFGRLRDEVWHLPFIWIVSGNRADRRRYLEPPADSFFDGVIELRDLTEEEAAELLRRRAREADPEDPAAEVLLGLAGPLAQRVEPRTPRNLLAAAREALIEAGDDPTWWLTNWQALQRRAAELGRPAAMLFTELMDLAPVSASDERLLDRLGWTRGRAAQVLKELEDAGLVVASEAAPEGPGRPRKLYSPNSRYHAVDDLG